MTDKLTFSFNGPVKVRIGGQDIDLGAKSDALNYAGRNKDGPLAGFKADDGAFFRLKDKGGGRVDVIVYGEPEKLAKYQFKVRLGDLTKARFADGGDFRRAAESARNFTLDGKSLAVSQRDIFLRENAFVSSPSSVTQTPKPPATSSSAPKSALTPGQPPVSSAPKPGASWSALPKLTTGLQSDEDIDLVLSRFLDTTQGVSERARKLIGQIRDNLLTEKRTHERPQTDQRQEQVHQDHQQADSRKAALDQDSDGSIGGQDDPVFEVDQIGAPSDSEALSLEGELFAKLETIARDNGAFFSELKADYLPNAGDAEALPAFALTQAMLKRHGTIEVALKVIDEQENVLARSAAGEMDLLERRTDAIVGKLRTLNLKTTPIPDDGHCLYAAIAHAAGLGAPDTDAQPAMALRERLLKRALSLTDAQQIALTRRDDGSAVDAQSTLAFLTAAVNEIGRGLNVRKPSQEGWGTFHSLALAAIELQRPIIAIGYNDQANLYRPDGSSEALQGNWVASARSTYVDGVTPLIIPQASSTHWVSTEPLS